MPKKVFISFRGEYEFKVNTLRGLARFKNVDFVMDDVSLREAVNSKDDAYIALSLPLCAVVGAQPIITGGLGTLIALLEAIQQLNQYHHNWITYRPTAEALKHEKYLFLSSAGPYAAADNPKALLAERVESSVSQEHAKWASVQEQLAKSKDNSSVD